MDDETRQALKTTVKYLDSLMELDPNRQLADVTNYLVDLLND